MVIYIHYFRYFNNYFFLTPQFHNFIEGLQAISTIKFSIYIRAFFISLIDFIPLILLLNKSFYLSLKENFYKPNDKVVIGFIFCLTLLLVREIYLIKKSTSIFNFVFNINSAHKRNTQEMVRRYGTTLTAISTFFLGFQESDIIKNYISYGPEKVFNEKSKKYNLILIQVESLDSSVIFATYKGKYIAPFLYSLTKNSWFCPYVVAYHGIGATTDADFSILNALEASDKVPLYNLKSYDFPQSMANIFNKNGYKTIAFHNNDGSYFDRRATLSRMGFNAFFDMNEMGLKRKWWGAPDGEMFDFIKRKIINEKTPYFYYVITMSSHGPFDHVLKFYNYTNENIKELLNESDPIAYYYNAISYVDKELSNFVTFLVENLPDTHILIIGDHTPNLSVSSIISVDGEKIELVPFFFIPAKNSSYTKKHLIKNGMSQLDILPTAIDIAGIGMNIKTYGESIFSNNLSIIPYRNLQISRKEIIYKTTLPVK